MAERKLPAPRPAIAQFQPYRTQMLKADVRINANEWPEPNPASRYLTPAELERIVLNRYPGRGEELREALRERWGTSPDELILGNGSNELLLNAFLVFGGHGRKTLLFHPTYSMHGRLSVIAGGTVVEEMVGLPYEVTTDRALGAMARARPEIVVFTTPNNPTGNTIDDDVILSVAERYPETLVLVDEAYSDFAGTSLVGRRAEFPNMIMSKTFSKVLAAAGLRVGVLIVQPQLMGFFPAAAPRWTRCSRQRRPPDSRRVPLRRRGEPRVSRVPRRARLARARRHGGERGARLPELPLAARSRPTTDPALRCARRGLASGVPRRRDAVVQVAPGRGPGRSAGPGGSAGPHHHRAARTVRDHHGRRGGVRGGGRDRDARAADERPGRDRHRRPRPLRHREGSERPCPLHAARRERARECRRVVHPREVRHSGRSLLRLRGPPRRSLRRPSGGARDRREDREPARREVRLARRHPRRAGPLGHRAGPTFRLRRVSLPRSRRR